MKLTYEVNGNDPWHAAQHVAQGPQAMSDYPEKMTGNRMFRITIEEIEEEPKWWAWLRNPGEWTSQGVGVNYGVYVSRTYVSVYGTTADRDAKRDALLAAERKAGTP